jgi:type IV secretion system protein VirB8
MSATAGGSDLKTYFEEAKRWDQDRLAAAERSRRLAWTVAAVAAGLAIAAVAAVVALTPLKTVEPFVVRVDRATGAVDVMTGLKGADHLTYEEAVSKYFLGLYVRSREGWMPQAAEQNFRQVSILSTPAEQQRWAEQFRPANPQSPQVLWGQNGEALIDVRSISFVSPKVATVRFHRTLRTGAQTVESDWVATLAFTYTKAPMLEADRLKNPLGFQVSSYRADPEVAR